MRTLIINFKNYPEVLGEGSLRLARAAEIVAASMPVEIILAPPHPMLGVVASRARIQVFSQSISGDAEGASTGAVVAEAVCASGAAGTLLNHSEAPVKRNALASLLPRVKKLGLRACVCAKTSGEAVQYSRMRPEFIAIEPPELIGTGVAVSKAMPELVSTTVIRLRSSGYKGKILCGAGIVEGRDVERSVELGAQGVLVASSVVKARSWAAKIRELAGPLL